MGTRDPTTIIHKPASCTAYAVAKDFAESLTSHWSGSAGAIYPAVERLTRRGYLRKETVPDNVRRQTYALTGKGKGALRRWLKSPVLESEAQATYDAIRTKILFLSALPPSERKRFIADALAKVEAQLPILEHELEIRREGDDEWDVCVVAGMIQVLPARICWLARIDQQLRSG